MERASLRRILEGPHSATILGLRLRQTLGAPLPTPLEVACMGNVIPFPRKLKEPAAALS